MTKVMIDPVTRIGGHMSIELQVDGGFVTDAWCSGEMFRGLERIFTGRDPLDAVQLSQRICGVCPVPHGIASSMCLESAFGMKPSAGGRVIRNLMLGANFLHSHLLHFYQMAALDYADITALDRYRGGDGRLEKLKSWLGNERQIRTGMEDAVTIGSPFLPRYEGDFYLKDQALNIEVLGGYVRSLELLIKSHAMISALGGRAPHAMGLTPGGVTQAPTRALLRNFRKNLKEVGKFITGSYYPQVEAVAAAFKDYFKIGGFANFMSCGLFDPEEGGSFFLQPGIAVDTRTGEFDPGRLREEVRFARYGSASNLHPRDGRTEPDPGKAGAYSWIKAPRYDGRPMEVGPLARLVVAYLGGNALVRDSVDTLLRELRQDLPALFSVFGRHAARAVEAKMIAARMREWLDDFEVGGSHRNNFEMPAAGEGGGLIEAPRGTLGHWMIMKDRKIAGYQALVPTAWSCGPRDDRGTRGPVEQALIGTPVSDPMNPIEAARVVRSFDPCVMCAVHVVEGGRRISGMKVC